MLGIRELAALLRDALAASDPDVCTGELCATVAEELAATEKACGAARARYAARAADCGEHRTRGFASPHDWMARLSGSSSSEARRELATLEALEQCPSTKTALGRGEVSFAQAAEIARVPGCERELLDVARTGSLRALQDKAQRRHLHVLDPETIAAEHQRRREIRHWRDDTKMVHFVGALPDVTGTKFVNRLDAETDRVWREARHRGRSVTRAQCAADAFLRITGITAESASSSGRVDLTIVADLPALARGHTHPGETCQVVGGGPIPVRVARDQAVEAFVKAVLHDGAKVETVVHYGRRRPAVLQTVLDIGHPPEFTGVVCAEEGCDRRYGLEWDHVDPVANGGPTSLENLEPRCRPHHVEKTERDRQAGLLDGKRRQRGPP